MSGPKIDRIEDDGSRVAMALIEQRALVTALEQGQTALEQCRCARVNLANLKRSLEIFPGPTAILGLIDAQLETAITALTAFGDTAFGNSR